MYRFARIGAVVVLASMILALLIPITMRISVSNHLYTSVYDVPESEVVIILGASVARGLPSPVLAARADAAIALYKAKKVSKILVTGDNGALSHDEVTPVRKYLVDQGIPASDIFLDHAGFDTYSSMYRARAIFQASSVIIVTQDFHAPRALYIARSLGLEAYVFEAGGHTSVYDYIREIPASAKALVDLVTRREPKYLGIPYPLTGDGQATWY